MQRTRPCLWFDTEAEEAATFYTSVFERSRIVKSPATERRARDRRVRS